ncbi:CDP-glycerol glycerophosphotransferase [Sediminihabitans luteus]|uniref:CDP-glycerol glycerophosphotransferase n=1 Tax=Sediminihabitans luteus TaxID=1138585 RepID=A0A2M9CDQ7_9CELL|nr:CDP-glycerol glycerophosphotransferase family protein [Sediminihabitans luteus]PJJ69995.1 CDP-glycerol glycerophosphotransferase [Sediminihabitans luteus]
MTAGSSLGTLLGRMRGRPADDVPAPVTATARWTPSGLDLAFPPGEDVTEVVVRRVARDAFGEVSVPVVEAPDGAGRHATVPDAALASLVEDRPRSFAVLAVRASEVPPADDAEPGLPVHVELVDDVERRLPAGPGAVDDAPGARTWTYPGRTGALMVRLAPDGLGPRPRFRVLRVRTSGSVLRVDGTVEADATSALVHLELRAQPSGVVLRSPAVLTAPRRAVPTHRWTHDLTVEADVSALVDRCREQGEELESVQVRLVESSTPDDPRTVGVGLPRRARIVPLRELRVSAGDRVALVLPYQTFKARNLAFRVEHHSRADHRFLRRLTAVGWAFALARPFARVWLVGEMPYKAQDTGARYFEWLRTRHPRRRVYYPIAADSPERARVEHLGNVVVHGSRRHMVLSLLAQRVVSSHHAEYVLASRTRAMRRWARGNRVFLQHGIMGVKNMVLNYGRTAPEFSTDRFLVSSEREKEMIVNDFGYRPRQVAVTGLSRFDRLLADPVEDPRGVVVIPTWRDWLQGQAPIEDSEYLLRWREVLEDPRLAGLAAAGHPVTMILHPNMRHHAALFEAPGVTVLRQGDADVQDLLRSHAALVTDFSSVALDFAIQHRPVHYFQFDRPRFLGRRPSHLDLEHDLPGSIHADAGSLLDALVAGAASGWTMSAEHRRRADALVTHRDTRSCERIDAAVRSTRGPRVAASRLRDGTTGRRLYAVVRRSTAYFPVAKAAYRVARLLPRRDTVVLESWNGKKYGDSPAAMYEELVARGSGLRTVWITSDTFRPRDPATVKVARLTPRYYWELARARYWVSNQNFPHYLAPARGTTYVQTWHGTPLKCMQFDAVSTTGRDTGYLDRSLRMTGYWTQLLSPSPYASARFRSAFRFEGEMVECGYPRNDLLVAGDLAGTASAVRSRLGLRPDARIVLYAPTFRDDVRSGRGFGVDLPVDWAELVAALGDDGVLVVRLHSIVASRLVLPEEVAGRVVDASAYPDMQELLAAADVLVTDYSSSLFDFALLRRPMVFFCYDLERYRDELRGFYLDPEQDLPGPVVRTSTELSLALRDALATPEADRGRIEEFVRRFAPWDDGRAASRAVDAMLARGTR